MRPAKTRESKSSFGAEKGPREAPCATPSDPPPAAHAASPPTRGRVF